MYMLFFEGTFQAGHSIHRRQCEIVGRRHFRRGWSFAGQGPRKCRGGRVEWWMRQGNWGIVLYSTVRVGNYVSF